MRDIRLNDKKLKNTNTATRDALRKLLELFVVETMYASIVNTFSHSHKTKSNCEEILIFIRARNQKYEQLIQMKLLLF